MVSHTNTHILIFVLSPALVAFTANKEIKCSDLVKFYYVYEVYCLISTAKQNVLAGGSISCFLLMSWFTELQESHLVTMPRNSRHSISPYIFNFPCHYCMPGLSCLIH